MAEPRYIRKGEFIYDTINKRHMLNEDETLAELNEKDRLNIELYTFRLVYNAYLFNQWHKEGKYPVYKTKKHDNGEVPFNGEYFLVYAILPNGQVTNHYPIEDWELFQVPEKERMHVSYDGHTPQDVLERLWNNLEIEVFGKII